MKLDKIQKKLSAEVLQDLDRLNKEELHATIAAAEEAIAKATRERNALPGYQSAKQAVKDLSEGLKEVKSYQTAKIAYSLRVVRFLNGESVEGDEE